MGVPGLLANCEDNFGNPTDVYGPMDPTNVFTFQFLQEFFDETTTVFPDEYLFIGGDEVELDNCWWALQTIFVTPSIKLTVHFDRRKNKRIADTLDKWGMRRQFDKLEEIFLTNFIRVLKTLRNQKEYIGVLLQLNSYHSPFRRFIGFAR